MKLRYERVLVSCFDLDIIPRLTLCCSCVMCASGVIFTHTHTHTLPPDMSNTYRTLSQHLNDLKKENFSLKLRIYFLEERIQQKFEDSSDEIYRTVRCFQICFIYKQKKTA
uniref:Centrosomin N-terminal motif 1 domain-containing protein n=1 Tax=Sinocyclocheilus rhinocerous TaxID=307959 RepID=A0A673KY37_9TELE